ERSVAVRDEHCAAVPGAGVVEELAVGPGLGPGADFQADADSDAAVERPASTVRVDRAIAVKCAIGEGAMPEAADLDCSTRVGDVLREGTPNKMEVRDLLREPGVDRAALGRGRVFGEHTVDQAELPGRKGCVDGSALVGAHVVVESAVLDQGRTGVAEH